MQEITNRHGEKITVDDENQILDTINRWLEKDVRDQILELEHADTYPHEMVEQMKDLGLFGATISQDYGGMGLPSQTYAKIVTRFQKSGCRLQGFSILI